MSCCHETSFEDGLVETIQVGKQVPNLIIQAYSPLEVSFVEISLEDLQADKKWVVLFFYPADFTFVCPTELADLAQYYDELSKMGVEVISLSTDSKFAHLAWRDSEALLDHVDFAMGEDPTGQIADLFGLYDGQEGKALRGTIIINPDGMLQGVEISFDNVGRNAAELVRKMEAHVYLRDHPTEVCPAHWQRGDKTLTPSTGMVGNVASALK